MGLSAFNRMRERRAAMQSPPPAPEPERHPGQKPPAQGEKKPKRREGVSPTRYRAGEDSEYRSLGPAEPRARPNEEGG